MRILLFGDLIFCRERNLFPVHEQHTVDVLDTSGLETDKETENQKVLQHIQSISVAFMP